MLRSYMDGWWWCWKYEAALMCVFERDSIPQQGAFAALVPKYYSHLVEEATNSHSIKLKAKALHKRLTIGVWNHPSVPSL